MTRRGKSLNFTFVKKTDTDGAHNWNQISPYFSNSVLVGLTYLIVDSHILNWNKYINWKDMEKNNQLLFQFGALPVKLQFNLF